MNARARVGLVLVVSGALVCVVGAVAGPAVGKKARLVLDEWLGGRSPSARVGPVVPMAAILDDDAPTDTDDTPDAAVLASDAAGTSTPAPAPSTWLRCEGVDVLSGRPACYLCKDDADCLLPDEACALHRPSWTRRCVMSECSQDGDCERGWSCRSVGRTKTVKRCVEGGERRENERCERDPVTPSTACRAGLFCVGGFCSRACGGPTDTSCPRGASCVSGPDGFVCTWGRCDEVGCPFGERCIKTGEGSFTCARRVSGENCALTPCAPPARCDVETRGDHLGFQCVLPCSLLERRSCGEGNVCAPSRSVPSEAVCYRRCGPGQRLCPRGFGCWPVSDDMQTFGCLPVPNEE